VRGEAVQAALPTTERVGRALEEVYARPEFAGPDAVTLMDRIRELLWRALVWFFDLVGGLRALEHTAPVLFWIIVAWLVVSALAILGHLLYTTFTAVGLGERAVRAGAPAPAAAVPRPRSASDWEAAARRAAQEGRFREASLALYQALLLRLDARGAVRFDPAKTPGDYRREARGHPEARVLASFLRAFEPVAFGGRSLDPDGYERLRAAAGEVAAGA
jgi:hypothetical protein